MCAGGGGGEGREGTVTGVPSAMLHGESCGAWADVAGFFFLFFFARAHRTPRERNRRARQPAAPPVTDFLPSRARASRPVVRFTNFIVLLRGSRVNGD